MPLFKKWVPVVVLALLVGGCELQNPLYNARFLAFGTLVDLTIIGVDNDTAEKASAAIQDDFAYMHSAWHAWDPGPLGMVNRLLPQGEAFSVPPSVKPLIEIGQRLSEQSNNLFNPAIGKLIDLWGFHADLPDEQEPPSRERIRRLVSANPRMSDLVLDGILLKSLNPEVKLDFGGYGKGYGIDLAIQHLKDMGVRNAIINAGGDLRAIGDRDGQPWRIAIRRPSGTGVFAIIMISGDESVFTSGSYERNFKFEGKTYHHIIDPRSGYPADQTQSVTVVHRDATTADAAATALFIAGPDNWYEVARAMGLRYVLLVDNKGILHMNPAMAGRVQLLDTELEIKTSPPLIDPDNEER